MPKDDPLEDNFEGLLDPECIYRMVALACAAAVSDKGKAHTAVISVADSFLEYIDPVADNPAARQAPSPRKGASK
jgi:hypothetical protein